MDETKDARRAASPSRRLRATLRALTHHAVKLRHVGMRGIGREIGGQTVHVDLVLAKIVENAVDVLQRHLQMRVVLPAPTVVAFHAGPTHYLYNKAEPQWSPAHSSTCSCEPNPNSV